MHIPPPLPRSEAFCQLVDAKKTSRRDALASTPEGRWVLIAERRGSWDEDLERSLRRVVQPLEDSDDYTQWMLVGRSSSLMCNAAVFHGFLETLYADLQARISDPMEMVKTLFHIAMPYNNWPLFRSFIESKKLPLRDGIVTYMKKNRTNDGAMDYLLGEWLHTDSEYFAIASSMDVYGPHIKKYLKNVQHLTDMKGFVEWSKYVTQGMSSSTWSALERELLPWVSEIGNHNALAEVSGLELMAAVAYREKLFEPTLCSEVYPSSIALQWACYALYKDALEVSLNVENPHYFLSWPSSSCKSTLRDAWFSTVPGISSLMAELSTVSLDQYMDEIQVNGSYEEFRAVLEDAWIRNDNQALLDYAWNRYGNSNMIPLRELMTHVQLIQSLDSSMLASDAWHQAITLHSHTHGILPLPETEFSNAY